MHTQTIMEIRLIGDDKDKISFIYFFHTAPYFAAYRRTMTGIHGRAANSLVPVTEVAGAKRRAVPRSLLQGGRPWTHRPLYKIGPGGVFGAILRSHDKTPLAPPLPNRKD